MIPVIEQKAIILELENHLSKVAILERDVDTNLARADRLRQSILKKAFSGQLVPSTQENGNNHANDFPLAAE